MTSELGYRFDFSGEWSGGGTAFLNNARHAMQRHRLLNGGPDSTPIIARNYLGSPRSLPPRYVLAPQNAWPWTPVATGFNELSQVVALRIASQYSIRRAHAVLRISSAIPELVSAPVYSPPIHNVLDTGFEESIRSIAEVDTDDAQGRFVYIGSNYAYKNLNRLTAAYRRYRDGGGTTGLFIVGNQPNTTIAKAVANNLAGIDKVTIRPIAATRTECLAFMRSAKSVILPSLVEASPLSSLEAVWANPNVIMSDIPANREIFNFSSTDCNDPFFDPQSVGHITQHLWNSESPTAAAWHGELSHFEVRELQRDEWANKLAKWIAQV